MQGIPRRRRELAGDERLYVHDARREGIGWDEIGAAIGITADEARQQYGEPETDEDE